MADLKGEAHRLRHVELHKELDELVADFLRHNRDARPSTTTLMAFMRWSYEQTMQPTETEPG